MPSARLGVSKNEVLQRSPSTLCCCRRASIHRLHTDEPGRDRYLSTEPVHIGNGEVRWLKETFANQWQRTPTDDELRGLVAGFVEEELLAREAKTLGLDQNDTIVRRRLAQKLTFLVDDTSRVAEPSDEELRQFYNKNAERFRVEPRFVLHADFLQPRATPARRDGRQGCARIDFDRGRERSRSRRWAIRPCSRLSFTTSTFRRSQTCLVQTSRGQCPYSSPDRGLAR